MNKYPGFNLILREWFESFQSVFPEAHISCAGRGKEEQELKFQEGLSRAHWKGSSHNWNCAIDIFEMDGDAEIYEKEWFMNVLFPNLPDHLEWYGKPGSSFYELPHVEIKGWRTLRDLGVLKLVE